MSFDSFYFYTTARRHIQDANEIQATEKSNDQEALRQGRPGHRRFARHRRGVSARALAEEGADVAISYVASPDKAEAVVAELKAKGVEARAFKADQASDANVEQLVKEVAKDFGRLDILVNNAGVAVGGAVDDPNGDIGRAGAPGCDQHPRCDHRNPHRIEVDGRRRPHRHHRIDESPTRASFPGLADYAATKAAIVGYSKGAARDLGPRGITVNVVQPGSIDTDMNPKDGGDFAEAQRSQHALQRFGTAGRSRGRRRVPREPRGLVRDRHRAQRRRRLRRLIETTLAGSRMAPFKQ